MNHRLLSLVSILAAIFIASCTTPPTGSGLLLEPVSTDQLIPLARGNYWNYRDLSGKGGARPEGKYVIHTLERIQEAYPIYRDQETGSSGSRSMLSLVFYTTGQDAWGVTFDGIFFGKVEDDRHVAVYASVPKEPSLGEGYAGMRCVSLEDVHTPAGTFESYRFDRNDQRESYWWSRGVGLVRYRTTDSLGEESGNWVLESYKVQDR